MWDGTYESNKRQQGKGDNGTALQNIRSYVFTEKNENHFFWHSCGNEEIKLIKHYLRVIRNCHTHRSIESKNLLAYVTVPKMKFSSNKNEKLTWKRRWLEEKEWMKLIPWTKSGKFCKPSEVQRRARQVPRGCSEARIWRHEPLCRVTHWRLCSMVTFWACPVNKLKWKKLMVRKNDQSPFKKRTILIKKSI
jgi:hypothetical protein